MIDPQFYASTGPLTLAELIEGLNVDLDPKFYDETISSPSDLKSASIGQLSFFQDKRRKSNLETCKATACFVTERLASQLGDKHILPIISSSPRAHFARACAKLVHPIESDKTPSIPKSARVHDTAVIGAAVVLGENVKIGPYCVIEQGVSIGQGTVIESHVRVSFAKIGNNCHIKAGAVIGGAGFGVAKDEIGIIDIPHMGRVIVGNRVSIGSQTCVDRGQLGDTVLANDVKIDNLVQVGHNVTIGAGSMLAGHTGISGSCVIGSNVQMGGNVGIADHLTIGDNVMIAARAGVMHNIPKDEVWSGIPAMPIREHMRVINATRKLVQKPKQGDENA